MKRAIVVVMLMQIALLTGTASALTDQFVKTQTEVQVESARVQLTKQVQGEAMPGDRIKYTITIQSLLILSRVQITVEDNIPAGLTLDKSSVTESTNQARLTVTDEKITWEWPEQPLPVPAIIEFVATVNKDAGGDTITNVVEMEICQRNKSNCDSGTTEVSTKVNAPEVTCIDDIELTSSAFQPVQVVWNDKEDAALDKNYLTENTPKHWETELPLVQHKNTVLFGIKSKQGRDHLHFTIVNHGSESREVALRFSAVNALGVGQRLYDIRQGRLNSKTAVASAIRLPGAAVTDTCVGSRTEVFVDAPLDANTPFTLEDDGPVDLMVEVMTLQFNTIDDAKPFNQTGFFEAEVNETQKLSVLIKPLAFENTIIDRPLDTFGPQVQLFAQNSNKYLQGVFPLREITQIAKWWEKPHIFKSSLPIDSIGAWRAHFSGISGATNNETKSLRVKELKKLNKKLSEQITAERWAANYDKIILLADPRFLNAAAAVPSNEIRAGAFTKDLVVINRELNKTAATVAHELTHTIPYLWSKTKMQEKFGINYHNRANAKGNGYWVNEKMSMDGKSGIMGNASGTFENFWIEQPTYFHLVEEFSKPALDPVVLGVRAELFNDNTVEFSPWYVLDGDIDLAPGSQGSHAIVFIDEQDGELNRFGFTPSFEGQLDPSEDETIFDSSLIAFRLPYTQPLSRIEFRDNQNQLIGARQVSASPPSLSLELPLAGASVSQSDAFTVRWTAQDNDGDELHYIVLYSPDLGESWFPLGSDLTTNEITFATSVLSEGDANLVKIYATDGILTAELVSEPFSVVP